MMVQGMRSDGRFNLHAAGRFAVMVIAGLGLLTWVAYRIVTRTTRNWFETDLALRSELAVTSGRQELESNWKNGDLIATTRRLQSIARDERILAVAACGADGIMFASTAHYPTTQLDCQRVTALVGQVGQEWTASGLRTLTADLSGTPVHVTSVPFSKGEGALGSVVLLHDLGYVARREQHARDFLLLAFAILATGASIVTAVSARLAWRGFTRQMRRVLRGHDVRPEYLPLLNDVRELVERLTTEADGNVGGRWTAERLRRVLTQYLHGERVAIVANREPYVHERRPDGDVDVLHPASGLVTALEPVMRACSGVWVAHGSGSADRATADAKGRVMVPPGEDSYVVRRVWLTPEEEQGYYYGFSNEGLWPLCHVAHTRPMFRTEDWEHYQTVNRKFAEAVCEEVNTDDPIILVQDYHFALAPRLIRQRMPRATILTFWHVPWPNSERFGICPWRHEILNGLLGSSILGFHTQQHCNNFVDAVDAFVEARIDRENNAIVQHPRRTLVRPYPISIEWPVHWLSQLPSPRDCRFDVIAELRLAPDCLLGVGVDRLDYTKGIEERLLAVERMLDRFPEMRGRFTFIQLAAPSRTRIERYSDLNRQVEETAIRINRKHGHDQYRPIVFLRKHHEPLDVYRFYRAANVCYVSSLHDGMNLVAKEFVAARDDEQGVLVLSHFTGAARELAEALIVNPYDVEQASSALVSAVRMSVDEQRERMRALRSIVAEFNVYRWAGRMLRDAADLRRRERLAGRLTRDRPEDRVA